MNFSKVFLYFKDINLGYLTFNENKYVWTPNIENIGLYEIKFPIGSKLFRLNRKNPTNYNQIPEHFNDFKVNESRVDLISKAGINQNDTDFIKLCKMASLEYLNQDFAIKLK